MMALKPVTVNSRKFDNKIRRTWSCGLLKRHGPLLVFVGEFDSDIEHAGLGSIRRGTKSYEYYWLDRWYNVFRFHEPDGGFRNFYCNIAMPPTFADGVLDYIDLDIDILVAADLTSEVVDRDDFEKNSKIYAYPTDVIEKVEATVAELSLVIEKRVFPFDGSDPRSIF